MAKSKKPTASASYSKKKSIATPNKNNSKKEQPKVQQKSQVNKSKEIKLNVKKVEIISDKITKMNNSFESLIIECKTVLNKLTEKDLSPTL